ncbi:hypothetical protein CYLTODRAFT_421555 [Cylindrobasidium torrendii FP15055 ss-10]|uniref:Uncharacterized protein n=1 Tax=Cylindrobasidium torrendii FP15055 ss-10 TaxID=1314674 RepID=A0A0D7BDD9_9AGAR|nr:hypothetical protein CYLTODRAFT_421555 [Cylindrobasidium torrendii FP15055 ss-10]
MLYRAEDISLSEDFTSDVVNVALYDKEDFVVGNLERFGGLYEHGFRKYFKSPLNIMKVQPGMARFFRPSYLAFVPAEETLRDIFELYKANFHCDMSERRRFDEVPHLQTSTYSIGVDPCFQKDLFTRHPLTGKIIRHRHPYTTLPKFTLPVHPCIAALRAGSLISFSPDASPISKTLFAIAKYHALFRSDIPPRRRLTKALSVTTSTSSSSSSQSMVFTAASSRSSASAVPSESSNPGSSNQDTGRPRKRKLSTDSVVESPRAVKLQRRIPCVAGASSATRNLSNGAKSSRRPSEHIHRLGVRCA